MGTHDLLAAEFEAKRAHLRAVAYRMLGSRAEADDAVQEAWLRLERAGTGGIDNLRGWLTTVVARVCLDMLRSRRSRREQLIEEETPETMAGAAAEGEGEVAADPEARELLADSVGLALVVVLEMLTPAERVAFVLHDMFDLPFEEIAPIVGRSPDAARQLASRARRRVRGAAPAADSDVASRRDVVHAFLAAARSGDFEGLLAMLDPEVTIRADGAAVALGAAAELRGSAAVSALLKKGGARGAQPAFINGAAGAVWAPGGKPRVVIEFTVTDGKIAAIDVIADPAQLARLDIVVPDASG